MSRSFKGRIRSMHTKDMFLQVSLQSCRMVTVRTLEGFLSGVGSDVVNQFVFSIEGFGAHVTAVSPKWRARHLQIEKL